MHRVEITIVGPTRVGVEPFRCVQERRLTSVAPTRVGGPPDPIRQSYIGRAVPTPVGVDRGSP